MKNSLQNLFGNIDIYLFDQLLKGRFDHCENILDAGCGNGRNLAYFLQGSYQVYGIDQDSDSINQSKALCRKLSSVSSENNFIVGRVEEMPFADEYFDLVISSAVLHFAINSDHFYEMLFSMWRVLKPKGYLFIRLASDIGIENKVISLGNGRFYLPDGSERYLVNQEILLECTHKLKGTLFENIKTTNVQNMRCMTTWCVQKS